ncbi:MAG: hypothetical protein ACI808_002795 [Paraglaciecola sp.]|jgi:hypothetical protein
MKLTINKMIALLFCFSVSTANAIPIITNGSLTGTLSNGGVPTGWSILSPSPDTMDENSNLGFPGNNTFQTTPSASPDGGTWIGMASLPNILESFGQLVTGFSIGLNYDLAWYHANFGHDFGFNQANAIQVLIDGNVVGNGAVLAIGTDWFNEMLSFTATSTSHQIEFRALNEDFAYQSIDGIRLTQQNIATVSAPATFALFGLGFVLLIFSQRKTKNRCLK